MPSISRNHLISNSQHNMRSSTQLQRPSRLNQKLTLISVWDVWMACLCGFTCLQKKNVRKLVWAKPNLYVEGRASVDLTCRQSVTQNDDSLTSRFYLGLLPPTYWYLSPHPQLVYRWIALILLPPLGCVYSAIMPTSIDDSWPRQYLT